MSIVIAAIILGVAINMSTPSQDCYNSIANALHRIANALSEKDTK